MPLDMNTLDAFIPTVNSVLYQHASELPFLQSLRSMAIRETSYSLADLARLDHRVEAHIDGLRVAGEEGWQLARKELAWKEPGEAFAASILAFENNHPGRIAEILGIASAAPKLAQGVISALGWMDYDQAAPHIARLCASELRSHRRIGIAAAAIHRQDPGRALKDALSSGDPLLRARALRAVGELARTDLVPYLQQELNSKDPACRLWSAWSTALLSGYGSSIQILQSIAACPGPFRERALQLVLRRVSLSSAHTLNQQLSRDPESLRFAILGAGILGDPALVPWLIEQMRIPSLARVAGEAFSMITGVDLAYQDLDCKAPEDFEAGPNEDPQDDNVDMDPDEKLSWPDVALISQWWAKHRADFQPGVRHLIGKPISVERAEQVLRSGKQRQRAAAALELAILRPGLPLFEVRAPGFRQQRLLGSAKFG
jgi:uncharacterized protein (TIGR02270 family)